LLKDPKFYFYQHKAHNSEPMLSVLGSVNQFCTIYGVLRRSSVFMSCAYMICPIIFSNQNWWTCFFYFIMLA